jgi:uncharacterized membrane protein
MTYKELRSMIPMAIAGSAGGCMIGGIFHAPIVGAIFGAVFAIYSESGNLKRKRKP